MRRFIAMVLCLTALVAPSRAAADEKSDELARLAGDYAAEYQARTGQVPAAKAALIGLTLKIENDRWVQTYRGDVAPYKITLDLTKDGKAMQLDHQKVKAVRNCTYDLKGDTLTVTEHLNDDGEIIVTTWKRVVVPTN